MSAYTEVQTQIKDQEALLEALQSVNNRLGRNWTLEDIEVHETPQPLFDYMGKRRPQVANVIIRRDKVGGAANDIGFERAQDGTFRVHVSEYDSTWYGEKWQQEVNVEYGTKFVERAAKKNGYRMKKEVQADGSVKLSLSRWR